MNTHNTVMTKINYTSSSAVADKPVWYDDIIDAQGLVCRYRPVRRTGTSFKVARAYGYFHK